MKYYRFKITQEVDVGIEGDAAEMKHFEYILKECARLFFADGRTKTIGDWTAKGYAIEILEREPLDSHGWPLPKSEKPEADASGDGGDLGLF